MLISYSSIYNILFSFRKFRELENSPAGTLVDRIEEQDAFRNFSNLIIMSSNFKFIPHRAHLHDICPMA